MFFVNPPHIEDEAGEEDRSEGEDNEPINPLVDALFDEIGDLRLRVRLYC